MRAPGYRNELDRPDYRSRKERHRTETVHMRSDGSEFPVEVFWHEVNYDGCRARIAASFDISARRKAEAAARESLERYRTLFENCPVGIYRTTADGRILMANPALLRTLGYSPFEEIANLNLETDSIAHSRRVNGFVAKILAHGELPRFEMEASRWISCAGSGACGRSAHDRRAGLRGCGRGPDRTTSSRGTTAPVGGYSRSLIENATDMITVVDASGKIRFQSPSSQSVLGFAPEEVVGRDGFTFIHPEDVPEVRSELAEVVAAQGCVRKYECRLAHRLGGWRNIEITAKNLLRDPAVGGVVLNSRDITERRRAQRQIECAAAELARKNVDLHTALAQAREATELKSRFLANMSHEIRTPMSGVIGLTDLLLDAQLTAEQSEYAHGIRSSAGALLNLINDILDLAKIESSHMTVECIPFSPEVLAREVAMLMRVAAERKGLSFTSDVPPLVNGDPTRVRQTLMNLAGNAVKFTHTGTVRLTVTGTRAADGRAHLMFSVEDTGIGISPNAPAPVSEVPPARQFDHAHVRGDRPRTRDFTRARAVNGRQDRLRQRPGPRK